MAAASAFAVAPGVRRQRIRRSFDDTVDRRLLRWRLRRWRSLRGSGRRVAGSAGAVLPQRLGRRRGGRRRRRARSPTVAGLKRTAAAPRASRSAGSAGGLAEVHRAAGRFAEAARSRRSPRRTPRSKPIPEEVRYLAGLAARAVCVRLSRAATTSCWPARPKVGRSTRWATWSARTTNRPVLMLDDLMVALRSGAASRT